ncbi:MAG TPA: flavin reductase family protein [Firmicutes bacterium]|jgi:flavin reductase (DIM6/NTAB) family NADH-FMN oxidoreductase RutF|nr:flavin reductase family protein [Bacillota bacterium]
MQSGFQAIEPQRLTANVFKLIGEDWLLITAGTPEEFNMMTAGWGGFGILWGKPVCFCFIRPQRYTYGLMEKNSVFTLTAFAEKYRDILNFCGTKSGREVNKTAETGLTPVTGKAGGVYFQEADLVMECKKIYYQDLEPGHFLDPSIHNSYGSNDHHRMYIGEILNCLVKA